MPKRAETLFFLPADINAQRNHDDKSNTKADVVPKRAGGGSHSTADHTDHEGRPASGANQRGNAH